MVGRSEPCDLRERRSLGEALELGFTEKTRSTTNDSPVETSLSGEDLVASPAQLAVQEIITQAVQGVLNQNDSTPELVPETDPEAVTRAINALGHSPNASDSTRVGEAAPTPLDGQVGDTPVASSSSSSSPLSSEQEDVVATGRGEPGARARGAPLSDSSSASQAEALEEELYAQHGLEIARELSADEKSSVRATAQQSSEEGKRNVRPGSPDTPENESSSPAEVLATPLDEQLASSEVSYRKPGIAGRPNQANAEAARLLTLRGLRRILESCTSRKYAETVACCRRAIEKLEVGSEPDTIEVLEAIKKASRCGKIAAADIALDTLHRLLAYGFFDPLRGAAIEAEQFENLIETACSCIDTKDEGVYIRLTQVLLASATSTLIGLHQTILLAAVRTLYNIYLSSKASATQTTARAAIIQVVNVVFGPLRNAPIPAETIFVSDALEPTATLAGAALVHQTYRRQREVPAKEMGEIRDSPRSQSSTNTGTKPLLDLEPIEQCQKDAYLLFRALCKLASKRISESSNLPTESLPVRSRLLALQLIRDIIDACGPALLQHERFVFSLREYLTPTVLQNCMVQNQSVLNVALQLFERMLQLYRAVLKLEIAALFHAVVFRFLESPTVAPWQRLRIYQTIQAIAEDQQLLMDLFLNYDCDMHSPKLYERLVDDLCRIAISALQVGGARKFTAADRRACLGILATMLHSLKDWSQPLVDARRQLGVDDEDMFHALSEPSMPESSDERSAGLSARMPTSLGVAPESTRSSSAQGSALMPNGGLASSSERSLLESLRRKRELHEIAERFNRNADEGLRLAASRGLVDLSDPVSVARFLRHQAGLDKRQIGEYLGGVEAFQIKVMHAFTDMAELSELRIDTALRKHLATFHLPGEAQKIDRIAEKFAQRYYECNPSLFASADTAYILAYSIIMLNTDLHSPHIRRKMTLEDFIRNNRGINDGADLPRELLVDIYTSIQAEELRLSDTRSGHWGSHDFRYPAAMHPGEQQRAALFKEESERLLAQTRELFAQRRQQAPASDGTRRHTDDDMDRNGSSGMDTETTLGEVYYTANNVGHVRLMLEVSWQPILAALSQILENTPDSDREILVLCIDGFSIAVQIASIFEMDTERQALASALARFTKLHALPEIRPKNVDCIRILLKIAIEGGDTLGETWVDVLRAVSLLERFRGLLRSRTADGEHTHSPRTESPGPSGRGSLSARQSGSRTENGSLSTAPSLEHAADILRRLSPDARRPELSEDQSVLYRGREHIRRDAPDDEANSLAQQIPSAIREQLAEIFQSGELERVFTQTTTLSAAAMLDFMEALCCVATEEIRLPDRPRFFCLEQIVHVAHLNMDRIRLEWSRVWRHVANFLEDCLHHSHQVIVGRKALDALFEMARKFLEKEELANFNFQREVLRPLERCFELTRNESLRLRSVVIVEALVREHSLHMRSGWKCVFSVLQRAADDRSEKVVERAFSCLDYIVRTYFGQVAEVFVDALHTLAVFAVNRVSTSCATRAVEHIGVRAPAMVAEQRTGLAANSDQDPGRLWFPILTALANVCTDGREVLRAYATELLFRSLLEYGGSFSAELWVLVFRGVLAPIFDDLHHLPGGDRFEQSLDEQAPSSQGWAQTTGAGALHGLLMVFEAHHECMRPLFADILAVLRTWICQENESICREGMSCLQRFIDQAALWMRADDWDCVVAFLDELVIAMLPTEITREGSIVRSFSRGISIGSASEVFVADSTSISDSTRNRNVDTDRGRTTPPSGHRDADLSNEDLQSHEDVSDRSQWDGARAEITAQGSLQNSEHAEDQYLVRSDRSPAETMVDRIESGGPPSPTKIKPSHESNERRHGIFIAIRCKCVVQLLLIELVRDLVVEHYERLSLDQVLALAAAVHRSFRFAQRFNADLSLRFDLWRAGFMSQVPNLFRQDTTGRVVYLRILFRVLNDQRQAYALRALEPLLGLSSETLEHFNRRASAKLSSNDADANEAHHTSVDTTATSSVEEQRELSAYAPVVAFILDNMARTLDPVFERVVETLYAEFVTLIRTAEQPEVRAALSLIFQRLGRGWTSRATAQT